MDIWTVLKACIRRWYVFLPILGIALWIGNVQVQAAPPVYTATSSAALTGPALVPGGQPGEIIEVNPFLGGSLSNATDMAVSLMDSDPKRDQFFTQGLTLDYEVGADNSVIYFTVTGSDPTQVTTQASQLVTTLDTEIATLQNKPVEAPESRIRAVPLALPTVADEDTMAGLRMLAVIGILGLVLATAAALIVEGALQTRARRAALRPAEPIGEIGETGELGTDQVPAHRATARTLVASDGGRDVRDPREGAARDGLDLDRLDERAAPSPFEPDADTVVIADGPVTAARHGRRA